MLAHRQEELNVVESNTCSYYHPMRKPTSHTMSTKVSQITSWVPMWSLPWTLECKKWISIGLMDACICIERYLQLKDEVVQIVFEMLWKKIGENNWKAWKIVQIVSQAPTLGLEHDKIWTQWVWVIYFIGEHVGKGMMMKTFHNENLTSNHLLPNELLQWWKRHVS
jgi:hypothetical protein